jgi:hypothetical protein
MPPSTADPFICAQFARGATSRHTVVVIPASFACGVRTQTAAGDRDAARQVGFFSELGRRRFVFLKN